MKKLVIFVCLLTTVFGCAGTETRVDQTVRGPQVKVGSYNIDISDDYKYLGQIPSNYMSSGSVDGTSMQTNIKIENHAFVNENLSEGIVIQVYRLPGDWHYRTEVDFDEAIRKQKFVTHGRKNNLPYIIQLFNTNDKTFLKLIKFANEKGYKFEDKPYVYMLKQGRNSGRNKRFFVHYIRGLDNNSKTWTSTMIGEEIYKSADKSFTITK